MKRWRDFATQWAVVVHLSHFLSRDSMRIHKIHTICIISAQYNGCWNSLINYLCQALGGGPTNNKVFEGQTNFEHHCRNASKSTDSFEVQAILQITVQSLLDTLVKNPLLLYLHVGSGLRRSPVLHQHRQRTSEGSYESPDLDSSHMMAKLSWCNTSTPQRIPQ